MEQVLDYGTPVLYYEFWNATGNEDDNYLEVIPTRPCKAEDFGIGVDTEDND